jgi:hypothetical protein
MMNGHYADGWDWAWMVPMMLTWIVLLGLAVYAAVRLANTHSRPPHGK